MEQRQRLLGTDNHYLTTLRDTCIQQETYNIRQRGSYNAFPPFSIGSNAGSGVNYDLKSLQLPPYGTDAASMALTPLLLHQEELLAAAAGNLRCNPACRACG